MRTRHRYFALLLPLFSSAPARAEKITIDDDTFGASLYAATAS